MMLQSNHPLTNGHVSSFAGRRAKQLPIQVASQRGDRGSRPATATAEFVILLPILTAIFLGLCDLGQVFYASMTVDNSLHNSLLFAAQTFDNQNQQWIGNNQYWQGPNGQILSTATAAAQLDGANLNPAMTTGAVQTTPGADANGNSVMIVTITYTFQTAVPYPGLPSTVVITRTGQVRVAPAVPSAN
jgi:hypothetical protein